MRRLLRSHIPSMFHRRLLLLLLVALAVVVVLGTRTALLTTGTAHASYTAAVDAAMQDTRLIPTIRGRILDRWGRVLAVDEPGFDVAVDYRVISGEWAYTQAHDAARAANRGTWAELHPDEREALIADLQRPYDEQVELLWRTLAELSGSTRADIERRKSHIVSRVQKTASHLWTVWQRQREARLGEAVPLADVAQPIGEQRQHHSILRDVGEATRVRIQSFLAEADRDPALAVWKQVRIDRPRQRRYPLETMTVVLDRSHLPTPLRSDEPLEMTVEGVAVHAVGQMRDFWAQDAKSRPFTRTGPSGQNIIDRGGYLDGDRVGKFGVEAAMEHLLRGLRGQVKRQLDTGYEERLDPQPGRDVQLTLDAQLQARIQGIMSPEFGLMKVQPWHIRESDPPRKLGEPLNGAAVVLDVATSEVLAAVSIPSMPLRVLEESADEIYGDDENRPYVDRVISQPYQPGSTVKPLVLVSAVTLGVHSLGAPIPCNGHLNPGNPEAYRCWIYKAHGGLTHGPLMGPEAIARSCNIYFYALGRDLGSVRMVQSFSGLGLGAPTDAGLPGEVGGDLPNLALASQRNAPGFQPADATFMGIGQGPIRWTPIQAVNTYAILARGGIAQQPTFIKDESLGVSRPRIDLHLNRAAVAEAVQGLRDVANAPYGTGRSIDTGGKREPLFDVEGVTIYGKSGTAQAVPLRIDANGDKQITVDDPIVKSGDHAWFMALVKPDGAAEPTHVIAVVTEYAGSGSQVSGPIVNQIIHALQQEGYF